MVRIQKSYKTKYIIHPDCILIDGITHLNELHIANFFGLSVLMSGSLFTKIKGQIYL